MPSPSLPPGNIGLPLLGETWQFIVDPEFVKKRYEQHGSIFRTQVLGRKAVFMVGSEAAEFVLSSGMEHLSWREGWPLTFKALLGRSLFVQEGAEHRRNRRLMMPAFHGLMKKLCWQGRFDHLRCVFAWVLSMAIACICVSIPNRYFQALNVCCVIPNANAAPCSVRCC